MGKLRPSSLVFCLLCLAVGIPGAQAQWATDGAAVTNANDHQLKPLVVSDGRGGVIITWEDERGVDDDIYIQRLDVMGVRQWGADDTAVCTAVDDQRYYSLVSDDNEGAFMAWWDDRGSSYHTYAQHMDGAGAPLWTADGRWIDTGSYFAKMVPDGTGGAIITWEEGSTYPTSIAAQRLSTTGSKMWPGDYIIIGTGLKPYIVPDNVGGAVVGWARYQSISYDYWVHGMRLDAAGTELWPDATISPSYDCTFDAQIATDDTGGAIWAWTNGNSVVLQRRDGAGTLPWGSIGINPFHYVVTASAPQVVSDEAGGVFVVTVAGGQDLFMNRVLADGSLDWGPWALHLCDDVATQYSPQLAPDGAGGAYVVWLDQRNSATTGTDIYAQHVDADGNPQWAANGVPICRASYDQTAVQITATGTNSAVITWQDNRNTATTGVDVYAQAIHYDGSIGDPPFEVSSVSPVANAIHVPITGNFTVAFSGAVNLASLTSDNVVVNGSLSGLHEVNVRVLYKTITFNPVGDFDHGEVVTVVMTAGVESMGGDPLVPMCWSFTTATEGVGGEFLSATSLATEDHPVDLCAADLNGDGYMDLVAANRDSDSISVLMGRNDGTFEAQVAWPTGDAPYGVVAADLNRDGHLDLVTANYSDSEVSVFFNNGHGGFPASTAYGTGLRPLSVCAGDFDDDGYLDLATANYYSYNVSVMLNNGDGTFGDDTFYTTGDDPYSITTGDLDGDGYLDLVTTNYGSADLSVFLNKGTGYFESGVEIDLASQLMSVHSGDLDKDGDLDLVAASAGVVQMYTLFNNGSATFSTDGNYLTGSIPHGGMPIDVDGDEDLDLVYCNTNDDNIWVRLNDGSGGFGAETVYPAGDGPNATVAADFDGDGALDLATANRFGDDITVLLNHHSLSSVELPEAPSATALRPNVPNPFNPRTRIDYAVKQAGHVRLVIYSARGEEVATLVDEHQTAQDRFVYWDGRDRSGSQVASGVYFYKLFAGDFEEARKMVLVR